MKNLEQIKTLLAKEKTGFYRVGEDGLAVQIYKDGFDYRIIASWGARWDHVSMSLQDRCPTWAEMCWAKNLFWNPEETTMQLHPAESRYINNHDFCLHLWKPQRHAIPLPSMELVGIKT